MSVQRFKQIQIVMNTMKGGQGGNAQSFQLPPEMSKVISATIADTINGEILFCHDPQYLFAAKVTKTSGNVVFQRFNLPHIQKLVPIIKNYFIAIFNTQKLVIFQVWFNEEAKIMLKYVFNKNDKTFSSYFLREVVENMAQLHISYPQNQIYIYQFTVNGKVGHMDYVIGPQNKIKFVRQQLYGSKTIVCPQKKTFYYFTNFSNKFVNSMNLAKLQADLSEQYKASVLTCVCLPKIQQHYIVMTNLVAVNIVNNLVRYKISVDQPYIEDVIKVMQRKDQPTFSVCTYFDMIMVADSEVNLSLIFQIKQKASALVAIEYGNFNWFWTSTRKLVGLSANRSSFKLIESLKLNQKSTQKQETIQFVIEQRNEKLKQEKDKDAESRNDDFLVRPGSSSDLLGGKEEEESVKPKNEVHSYGTLPQKIPQQPALSQKVQSKQQKQEVLQEKAKFVPNKIIQKKGVNISKTLNKSKEIEPMTKAQQSTTKEEPAKIAEQEEKPTEDNKVQQSQINEQPTQSKNNEPTQAPVSASDKINQPETAQVNHQNNNQTSEMQEQKKNQDSTDPVEEEKPPIVQEENGVNHQKQVPTEQNKEKEKEQEVSNDMQDNLTKNVALMIQKTSIAGFSSSFSSIDRNKIFSSIGDKPFLQSLRKHQSQTTSQQYYNPFLSYSPLPIVQNVVQNGKEATNEKKQNPHQQSHQSKNEEQEAENNNEELIEKIKQLFHATSNRLLKSIQQVGNINTSQAYLKERVRQQIQKKVIETIKNHVNGELTNRLELYFKEVFRQTSYVQEESIKFYKEASSHKSHHIEVQLGNQEKVLKEMKDIQSMIRFSISSLRVETTQLYETLMREWTAKFKQTHEIIDNIVSVKSKLEEESIEKAKRFEEIKKNLELIKNKLLQKNALQEDRRNRKLQLKASKLKQEADKKAKKQKKREHKQPYEKQRKSKSKKVTEG